MDRWRPHRGVILHTVLFVGLLMMKVGRTSSLCNDTTNDNCATCVSSGVNCVWCSQRTANIKPSCMDRAVANVLCNLSYVEDPPVVVEVLAKENLSESVLISPQSVYLNLRSGQQAVFNVSVRTSRTYPLDFYFMMDLTGSLQYDVDTVRSSGIAIANLLKNISQNYKVGFGSFVDKPVPPFVANIPYRLPNGKCYNDNENSCIEPYAYRHILQMTNVTEEFLNVLDTKLNLSSAAENQQSGTDALAQAILCKSIVGWREEAFRMLMLISDNAVHFAGDGKVGGVVVPFDGQCHLEWNNATETYDYLPKYSTFYDWPSVAQLKSLIADIGVSVIFGIAGADTNNTSLGNFFFPDVYKAFAKVMDIPESSVAILSKNSTNILQVINDQYLKAIGLIKFSIPEVNGVKITVDPILGCNSPLPTGCKDVSLEKEVVFRVTVGLTHSLPTTQDITIPLRIPALAQQITININPNVRCACESKPEASLLCNNQTQVCGLCQCNASRYGLSCQCSGQQTECPHGVSGKDCSGFPDSCSRESCYKCQCPDNYFGDACECDRTKCLISSLGIICSGESNGVCSCSGNVACSCKRAPLSNITYMGPACNCDPDVCVNRETNFTCSDSSIGSTLCRCTGSPCSCSCSCPSNTVAPLCEPQERVNTRCNDAKLCAECGSTKAQSDCKGCVFISNDNQAYECGLIVSGTCTTDSYRYYVDTQNRVYLKRNTVTCDPGPDPIIIAFSVLGAIIALGLIFLIIAKIILICLDQVEFKKFTSQLEGADWAPRSNPLYMSPEQNYTNVLYRKRSYRGSK